MKKWSTPTARVAVPIDASREYWRRERCTGVTATDMRVLAGHGYSGELVYDRWLEKVQPTDGTDDRDAPRAWDLGLAEEPVIAHFAELDLGIELRRVGMLRHRDVEHLIASPDRNCSCGGHAELKDTNTWFLRHYQDDGDFTNADGWTLPPSWLVQSLHQMTVSGRSHVHICAKIADKKTFTYWTVEPDALRQGVLRGIADAFWGHVQTNTPPPVDWDTVTGEEIAARYPDAVIPSITADPAEVAVLLDQLATFKEAAGWLKKDMKAVETRLKGIAEDAVDVVDPNGRVLYSYPTRTRSGYTVADSTYRQLTFVKVVA